MPPAVVKILGKHRTEAEVRSFLTYAIRQKESGRVDGTLWHLSPEQREFVDRWEMNDGLWYQKTDVTVITREGITQASTEVIEDPRLLPASEIYMDPPVFLNPYKRMLEVARKVRLDYLRETYN